MNAVLLTGRLAREPSTRFLEDGAQTCDFTLGVPEVGLTSGKHFRLYVPCTAWGKAAERCGELSAGDQVEVQGKLVWRRKRASCGDEHSTLVVQVRDVTPVLQPRTSVSVPG